MNKSPRKDIKPIISINFSEASLFGNDAAEEEMESLFLSYAVELEELNEFLDLQAPLMIARAFKGEGKSALLRLVTSKIRKQSAGEILITLHGSDLTPSITNVDVDEWTREWKKKILAVVAREIGATIGLAFTDDAISLVEDAEESGFRRRSFVSSLIDRLKSSNVPIERQRQTPSDYEKVVQRYMEGRPLIWLIIDDVDQNFSNTERNRTKIATFFTACRQIINTIPEIRLRTAIRPNIWAIVKPEYESLSHVEQYMRDLYWSENDLRKLLAGRIQSYLARTGQLAAVNRVLPHESALREKELIGFVFDSPMPWGGRDKVRPPHVVLTTLSRNRPRWLIELSKEAARSAKQRERDKIGFDDIKNNLGTFGNKRIQDTVAEFKAQCPQIEELLAAFSHQRCRYRTDELVKTIHNRIMNAVHPSIVGYVGRASDIDVAQFLFQIGFLAARKDYGNGDYDHFTFAQKPFLLRTATNLDEGMSWEIHPVFREALDLRD